MQDQSYLTICMYPWTFKIVIAAFFDAFFIKSIGKCKTYIIICDSIKCVMMFVFSFYVNDMLDNREIKSLTWYYFCVNIFSALESIAVDAWLLTLLDIENLPKGAIADILGQLSGGFITYNIFGTLSNMEFLNKWIFIKDPLQEPLVKMHHVHLFVAIFSLISLIFIILFVSEKDVKRVSCMEMVKLLPKFFTNKYIRNYCIFLMGKYFFLICFAATYDFICIEKGYNYDYIIILGSIVIPVTLIANVVGSRWLKIGLNQRASIVMSAIALLGCLGQYILYKFYYHGPQDDTKLFFGSVLLGIVFSFGNMTNTYDTGFLNSIGDPAIGGLYLTYIACFMNLSSIFPSTLGTYIIKYLNYDKLPGWSCNNFTIGLLLCRIYRQNWYFKV